MELRRVLERTVHEPEQIMKGTGGEILKLFGSFALPSKCFFFCFFPLLTNTVPSKNLFPPSQFFGYRLRCITCGHFNLQLVHSPSFPGWGQFWFPRPQSHWFRFQSNRADFGAMGRPRALGLMGHFNPNHFALRPNVAIFLHLSKIPEFPRVFQGIF